ncbi:MAG: DUF4833 domain-containing protein [Bacteroidales bacterium]|nr:DUF4833 domain-containing protein [Bacteroidales bacterium]
MEKKIEHNFRNKLLLSLLIILAEISDSYGSSNTLFMLERTMDKNQIFYSVNLDEKNKLDDENPIDIHWLKRSNGNKVEPLTWIQNKFGYGLKFISKKADYALFQFASSNKRNFELKKDAKGQFKVYTNSEKGQIEVYRIFIHNNGGTFLAPKISAIDIYGKNPTTGETVVESMKF